MKPSGGLVHFRLEEKQTYRPGQELKGVNERYRPSCPRVCVGESRGRSRTNQKQTKPLKEEHFEGQ